MDIIQNILFGININCILLINKSLSGKVLSIKDKSSIVLPKLWIKGYRFFIFWKICINNISSKDCSLNFIVHTEKVSSRSLYYYLIKNFNLQRHFNNRIILHTNIF